MKFRHNENAFVQNHGGFS